MFIQLCVTHTSNGYSVEINVSSLTLTIVTIKIKLKSKIFKRCKFLVWWWHIVWVHLNMSISYLIFYCFWFDFKLRSIDYADIYTQMFCSICSIRFEAKLYTFSVKISVHTHLWCKVSQPKHPFFQMADFINQISIMWFIYGQLIKDPNPILLISHSLRDQIINEQNLLNAFHLCVCLFAYKFIYTSTIIFFFNNWMTGNERRP